jgi:hypothetical protein
MDEIKEITFGGKVYKVHDIYEHAEDFSSIYIFLLADPAKITLSAWDNGKYSAVYRDKTGYLVRDAVGGSPDAAITKLEALLTNMFNHLGADLGYTVLNIEQRKDNNGDKA